MGVDATDANPDAPWPVVFGCVTGLPPALTLNAVDGGNLVVGCAPVTRTVARLADTSHRGAIFSATLEPQVPGISLISGNTLCANDFSDTPINVDTYPAPGWAPGTRFGTVLRIQIQGPGPATFLTLPLLFTVVPIDFTLSPEVIDFGSVSPGTVMSVPITVTNNLASAGFSNMYPSPPRSEPFFLDTPFGPGGRLAILEPGSSAPSLMAFLSATRPGVFTSTFIVSPFAPGVPIDPSCGVIQRVTVRAQVFLPGGPP